MTTLPKDAVSTNNSESIPATIPLAGDFMKDDVEFVLVTVPRGSDIVGHLIDTARRGNFSFTIINGYGKVTSATLSPIPGGPPAIMVEEPSTIFALDGAYNDFNEFSLDPGDTPVIPSPFKIYLRTSRGQSVRGLIVGGVIAGGDGVLVVLATTHVCLLCG